MFTLFLQCINSTFSDDYYPYFAENTLFSLNSYFYYPIGSIKKHQILKHQFSKTHECPQQCTTPPLTEDKSLKQTSKNIMGIANSVYFYNVETENKEIFMVSCLFLTPPIHVILHLVFFYK
jgi:hypothetical protein